MGHRDDHPEIEEAVEAISRAIEEQGPKFGPHSPAYAAQWADGDASHEPPANVVLSAFVVVAGWTDIETGESWTTTLVPKLQPSYVDTGLIEQARYGLH